MADIIEERESTVLRTVVYEYIVTGKPVGSRTFVQKYSFSISPATMRNIMSDLESAGFLMQPHTSAGRIPTDKGYRYYVDSLLENYNFNNNYDFGMNEREDFIKREVQFEKIFEAITKMLSSHSKYAGVMLTPNPGFTVVKRIELIPLEDNQILLILITRTGMIINKKVVISGNVTADNLYNYSRYLTNVLSGYSLSEVKDGIINSLRGRSEGGMDYEMALDIVELALLDFGESELYVDGIENLLKLPEMIEEDRLKSLLYIIEEKNVLKDIMKYALEADGVGTFIGEEIQDSKVSGCSMVTTSYKIGNNRVGVIGVVGPTRMDYEKVVPLVDYTGRIVSDFLGCMSK